MVIYFTCITLTYVTFVGKIHFPIVFWYIWKFRSEYIFYSSTLNHWSILRKPLYAIHGVLSSVTLRFKPEDHGGSGVKCSPLPLGCIKLNFDGSIQANSGFVCIGGVIRDHLGQNLFAFAEQVFVESPLEAELLALHPKVLGSSG